MNKKKYCSPRMYLTIVEVESMLASSVISIGVKDTEMDAASSLSRDHRGTWGNLWENGEK